jgi:hypothetical protein
MQDELGLGADVGRYGLGGVVRLVAS